MSDELLGTVTSREGALRVWRRGGTVVVDRMTQGRVEHLMGLSRDEGLALLSVLRDAFPRHRRVVREGQERW